MRKSIFKIGKNSHYSCGEKYLEEYSVFMHSKQIFNCEREELLELRNLLNLALNDQNINVNEKGDTNKQ